MGHVNKLQGKEKALERAWHGGVEKSTLSEPGGVAKAKAPEHLWPHPSTWLPFIDLLVAYGLQCASGVGPSCPERLVGAVVSL